MEHFASVAVRARHCAAATVCGAAAYYCAQYYVTLGDAMRYQVALHYVGVTLCVALDWRAVHYYAGLQ